MNSDPYPSPPRRQPTKFEAGSTVTALLAVCLLVALVALFWRAVATATSVSGATAAVEFVFTVIVIVGLNGMFVAGDTAIDLLKNSHGKSLEDEGKKRIFDDLIARKANFVAACSLGAMTMRSWLVALAAVPAISFSQWLADRWGYFHNWQSSGPLGNGLLLLVSVLLLAIPLVAVNVVLGELAPKSYAASRPLETAIRLHGAVRVFNAVFAVPIAAFVWLGGLVTKRYGARATFAVAHFAEDEIIELLEEAEETGEIQEEEKEMVASVFEFGDTVAREVMTPRMDLEALPIDSDLQTVVRVVEESGHSRIPVYDGTDDTILGIVHAKDVLSAIANGSPNAPLRQLLRPALFVPESKPLRDLLMEMRQSKTQIAIVQDEHSGTAGVVTIEDIVEEVMGEIVDEYDEDLPKIVPVGGGYESDGRMELDEVNEALGSELASEVFDTIGGYVFGLFGRQPKIGEAVSGEGYRFTVIETDGKRILRLGIERTSEDVEPEATPF